jgi:hypothetical protein
LWLITVIGYSTGNVVLCKQRKGYKKTTEE